MRPMGTPRLDSDSSVQQHQQQPQYPVGDEGLPRDFGDSGDGGGARVRRGTGAAMEMGDGVDDDYGDGFGGVGRLSPTFIVYMSAFVSSLTSVLLGYGESRALCEWVHVRLRARTHVMCLLLASCGRL